jgi:CBS domain-containing protein
VPTVREFMNPNPVTVKPDTGVGDVAQLIGRTERSGVPVVDDDNRLVGIITENDLVLSDDEGDLHIPHYIQLFGGIVFLEPLRRFEDRLQKAFGSTARDLMTSDVITVRPDTDVHEAGRLVASGGHNQLPVVDEDGRLAGLITRADVLRAVYS